MADFQINKIPLVSGINDLPIAPEPNRGLNVGYLTQKINLLIDSLEGEFNNLSFPEQTNTVDLAPIEADILSLETQLANNLSSINAINNGINSIDSDIVDINVEINSLNNQLLDILSSNQSIAETHPLTAFFFCDSINGSDTNLGTSTTEAVKTFSKLQEIIEAKRIRNEINIKLAGSFSQSLNLKNVAFEYEETGNFVQPKIAISGINSSKFSWLTNGDLIIFPAQKPIDINISNVDLTADGSPIYFRDFNKGIIKFFDAKFDTTSNNSDCILYFSYSNVEMYTSVGSLVFNNPNSASLDSLIKLFSSEARIENLTINDTGTFCIAENSKIKQLFASGGIINSSTDFDLRNKSEIYSRNYPRLEIPYLLLDDSSEINKSFSRIFTFFNPINNFDLSCYVNRFYRHKIILRGNSFTGSPPTIRIKANGTDLSSLDYYLERGAILQFAFEGNVSPDYVAITVEFHRIE